MTVERAPLNRLVLREVTVQEAVRAGVVRIEGDAARVAALFGLLDDFEMMFEVVEPKAPNPHSLKGEGRGEGRASRLRRSSESARGGP